MYKQVIIIPKKIKKRILQCNILQKKNYIELIYKIKLQTIAKSLLL